MFYNKLPRLAGLTVTFGLGKDSSNNYFQIGVQNLIARLPMQPIAITWKATRHITLNWARMIGPSALVSFCVKLVFVTQSLEEQVRNLCVY